ncbi:MAG: GmrSD restriction endonuclease domain-containing protein [Thermomicrobiales bacterium]
MLKGFLLANITDEDKRNAANDFWKQRTQQLRDVDRETEPDFFKAWLRSQYAETDRERHKGAKPDFDRIGAEFHRWVREHATDRDNDSLTLRTSEEFLSFIWQDFDFYSRQHLRLMTASQTLNPGLEHVLYNARVGFTLQYMLLLAPMQPDDTGEVAQKKARLVAMFVDTLLAWRVWNYRSITYNNMQYAMFRVMRDIRGLAPEPLAERLHATLAEEQATFATNDRLSLHPGNGWPLFLLLARMTDYIEQQSGMPSHYLEYVGGSGNARYEIEHIWANKPERHSDEFDHAADFADYRNRLGGLLLLPKSFNASYGALPYPEKLKHYNAQNLLARSLHPDCYNHNPGFLQFIARSGLPFRPHLEFKKADLEERQNLYREIAERIWDPDQLLREVE